MEFRYLIKALLLPPVPQIIVLLLALLLRKTRPRLASLFVVFAVLSLWGLASPVVSNYLASTLERYPPLLPEKLGSIEADAIVILGGRQNERAAEFGEPVSAPYQLSRLRYGAFIHRKTGIPILLSGGSVSGNERRSLAETMAYDLQESFGIRAEWIETRSRTTAENAKFSYLILSEFNKKTILLVTNSMHMVRAKLSFESMGFNVLPASTDYRAGKNLSIYSFLPTAQNLNLSSQTIHEWIGYWYYAFVKF